MTDPRIDLIAQRIEHMSVTLDRVADAISRLAVVEERQMQTSATLGRVFQQLDKHDARIDAIEKAEPEQRRAAKYVHHGIWAAACAAAVFVARQVGLA